MATHIIGIIGKAKSGKDTAAKYLTRKWGFKQVAFADKLKSVCKDLYGLTDYHLSSQAGKESIFKNNKTVRTILQETGDGLRAVYINVWVDYLCNKIHEESCPIVVSDVRRMNELQELLKLNAKIIRIQREKHSGLSGKEAAHMSEIELDSIDESCLTEDISVGEGEIPELFEQLDCFVISNFGSFIRERDLSYSVVQRDKFNTTWYPTNCNFCSLFDVLDALEEEKEKILNLSFAPSLGIEINSEDSNVVIASICPVLSDDGRTFVWSNIVWDP